MEPSLARRRGPLMNVICAAVITGKIIRSAVGESEWGHCAALAHEGTIHCFVSVRPTAPPTDQELDTRTNALDITPHPVVTPLIPSVNVTCRQLTIMEQGRGEVNARQTNFGLNSRSVHFLRGIH